jgi:hypothetical protein
MNVKRKCITFAGPAGCSKTPVAHYLSCALGWPIFNADAIRSEVREDTLSAKLDEELFRKRRDVRLRALMASGRDFVLDASVDRTWPDLEPELEKAGYEHFIISYELSDKFLTQLYEAKGYQALSDIVRWQNDHRDFLDKYEDEVGVSIDDANFESRLEVASEAVQKWVSG